MEFALLLPVLMLFLFGVIQYGYGLFQMQAFSAAVSDATQSAATGISDCGAFSTKLKSLAGGNGLGPDDVSGVTVQWLTGNGAPTQTPQRLGEVQVSASFHPFKIGLPFLPFPDTITRSSTASIQSIGLPSLTGCS